ncbi:MAG: hypothetical protein ACO21J_09000 [Anaerohalosphaeraceae bacterium]|jgi:hypothetical protein
MKFKKKRATKNLFLLLCLCSVGLAVLGYLRQPSMLSVTLSETLHVGVWNEGLDSRLVVFSDDEYDPADPMTHFQGTITERAVYFNAVPGIYYRYIRTELEAHWVCLFSLWYPIGVFGLLVILFQMQENYYRNFPGKTDPDDNKEAKGQT